MRNLNSKNKGRFRKSKTAYEQLEARLLLTAASPPNAPLSTVNQPVDVRLGFIDNDDRLDMALLGEAGDLTVALNGGDNWRDVQTTDLGLGPLHAMQLADTNADIAADLIVQGPDSINVLISDGTGAFSVSDTFTTTAPGTLAPVTGRRVGLEVAQLDQDPSIDVVTVAPGTNEVLVFLNVIAGALGEPDLYPSGAVEPTVAVTGNFVGELFPDLAVGHADGTVTFLEGLGDGTFASRPELSVGGLGTIVDLAAEDYDRDGDTDLAVSGGSQTTLLFNDDDLQATAPFGNGDFANGLTNWATEIVGHEAGAVPGDVNVLGGFVQLVENESFVVSVHQTFEIPPAPETISVDILSLELDDPSLGVPDAFEISLLDDSSSSLVPTWRSDATSFFNAGPDGNTSSAAGVTFDGTTVTLDISSLAEGTEATLYFDLIGNPPGTNSVAAIDNVRITPAAGFTNTFTAVPLSGPFIGAEGISQGDVDGDGFIDIVVADTAADVLIVFNGDGTGVFSRSEIDLSAFGSGAFATDAGQLTAGDTIDDVVVTLLDSNLVVTPLDGGLQDSSPPGVALLDPTPGQLVTTDISQIALRYSENVQDNGSQGSHSVTNSAAYELVNLGPNGTYDGGLGDDVYIGIASVTYDPTTFDGVLLLDAPSLPDGDYQLTVEGDDATLAIQDIAGNALNGGADSTMTFVVNTPPELLTLDFNETPEGASVNLLSTFSDPGFLDTHTAVVDWGDGTTTIASVNESDGTIAANHIYADNGAYAVALSMFDAAGNDDTISATADVANVSPAAVPSVNLSAEEGQSQTFTLAMFSDPGFTNLTAGTEETFTATIDWGDGSPSGQPAEITVAQGAPGTPTTGTISGTHTFADDGSHVVTVFLEDDDGGTDTFTVVIGVENLPPAITRVDNLFGNEGEQVTLVAHFTDPGTADTHTAVVNWSDGTSSPGVVTESNGQGTVTATHPFADNGIYPLDLQVIDNAGDVATATPQATIYNVRPTVIGAADQTLVEGEALDLNVATFTDPGFTNVLAGTEETFTATIDWGDGTVESGTVTVSQGGPKILTTGSVQGQHVYVDDGEYTVSVAVIDDDGGSALAQFIVTVLNASPEVLSAPELSGPEGESLTLTATFGDSGQLDTHTATIDWGDGTTSPATVDETNGSGSLTANHVYADNGVYSITIEVVDNFGASGTLDTTANVANIAPEVVAPSDRRARAGQAITLNVAQFTDPGFTSVVAGTEETFTATIDWGDGSPIESGQVSVVQGTAGVLTSGTVSGTHTYGSLGDFTVTVTVTDDDGDTRAASFVISATAKFFVVDVSSHAMFQYGGQGSLLGQSDLGPFNNSVRGVTTNPSGDTAWVVDASKDVFVYNRDGSLRGSWEAKDINNPQGIASNGTDIWIVGKAKDEIRYYANAAQHLSGDFSADAVIPLESTNKNAGGITTDGETLWVVDESDNDPRVYVYSVDGDFLGQWFIDSANTDPSGITIDLANGDLWTVDRHDGRAYLYADASSRRDGAQLAETSVFLLDGDNHNPEGIADPVIMINIGDVISDSILVAGEVDEWVFDGTAGQNVFFDAQLGDPFRIIWSVFTPSGIEVFSNTIQDYGATVLTETGQFTIRVEENFFPGSTYQFQLHDVPVPIPIPIVLGTGPTIGEITVPGEEDIYTFDGVAGDEFYIDAQGDWGGGGRVGRGYTVFQPDGSVLFETSQADRDTFALPASGTYTIVVGELRTDGLDATGGYQFQLLEVPAADVNAINIGGIANGEIEVIGATDVWLFDATAGQGIFFQQRQYNAPSFFDRSDVELRAPDGSLIYENLFGDSGTILLPQTGTYTLEIDGQGTSTASYEFQLWEVPPPDIVAIGLGETVVGEIETPGVLDQWTFAADVGDTIFIDFQQYIHPPGERPFLGLRLIMPDGSVVSKSPNADPSNLDDGPRILDQTGTYVIEVFGSGPTTAGYRFQLLDVPPPDVGTFNIGDVVRGEIETPGVVDQWLFDAAANETVYLDFQQLSGRSARGRSVELRRPDGSILLGDSGGNADLLDNGPLVLNQAGIYTLTVDGVGDDFGLYQFQLWDVPPETMQSIIDDAPVSGSIDVPGQTATYSFAGTTGQPLTFDIIHNGLRATKFTLLTPSGATLFSNATDDQAISSLPATGTYTLVADADGDDRGAYSFRLVNPAAVPPLPVAADLVVTDVSAPVQVIGNPASVDVTLTITNMGLAPTDASSWKDRVYLSLDTELGIPDDILGVELTHDGVLAPGESYTQSISLPFPINFEGEFLVFGQADATNHVFEADAELNNYQPASSFTAIFAEPAPTAGDPVIRLDLDDRSEFPANTTVTLSGQAKPLAASANVVFVLDLSGSTAEPEGLDANFDGVLDLKDDLNGDLRIGDILDTEIGAALRLSSLINAQTDNARLAVVGFGQQAEPLDLSPTPLNQSLQAPDADANQNGIPDIDETLRSLFAEPPVGFIPTNQGGAARYRPFNFFADTNFQAAIQQVDGLLERALPAEQTQVIFLTDGEPTAGEPTDEELQSLASRGVRFHAFQIAQPTIPEITPQLQRMADVIDAIPGSTGNARLVSDANDLLSALLASLEIAGVTINDVGVQSFDAGGNFFSPVSIGPGENVFVVEAIDTNGNSSSESITIIGTGVQPPEFEQFQDISTLAEVSYARTTFNRSNRTLYAAATITNLGSDPIDPPVLLAFESFSPPSVELGNAEGTTDEELPFVSFSSEIPSNGLGPGESSATKLLAFQNPQRARFSFDVSVLALGNSAPNFSSAPPTQAVVGVPYKYSSAAFDPDGNPLSFALVQSPSGMSVDPATGVVTWTPLATQAGLHQVELIVSDGRGGSARQSYFVDTLLAPSNLPPIFQSAPETAANTGENYAYSPEVLDLNGDPLEFFLDEGPTGMTINASTGLVEYPSAIDGNHTVTIRVEDGQGGNAVQSYVLSVGATSANPGTPIFRTFPATEATASALYLYLPFAQDPDGDTLTYSLPQAPTGMQIDPLTGRIDWIPDTTQLGPQTVLLRVDDAKGGIATQFYTINVSSSPLNRPPVITSFPEFIAAEDEAYTYQAVALDPDGNPITFQLTEAPAGMSIGSTDGEISWTPSAVDIGLHRIQITATDFHGAVGVQTFDLEVRPPNLPPAFTTTPITEIFTGEVYRYDADAFDDDPFVTFNLVSAPTGMTIDSRSGIIVWRTGAADLGSHSITIEAADDRGGVSQQNYVLDVLADVEPPVVSVILSTDIVNPAETVTIQVIAVDNVSITDTSLLIDGTPVTLDANNFADFTPAGPGLVTIVGSATDTSGNSGTATVVLRVLDPADTTPPVVELTNPPTGAVVTYLTDIVGTVTDENLEFYRVDYARADTVDRTNILADNPSFVTISESTTEVVNDVLGVFDPTVVANDDYIVRVVAQDVSGNINVQAITLGVSGQAKLGQFTLEFPDLTIPFAGIPIQVNRIYDTHQADQPGDFGFGWRVGFQDAKIRETVPVAPNEATLGLFVAEAFTYGTRVYLTNPDGRRVGFTFEPVPQPNLILGTLWEPQFTPDPGVFDRLEVDGSTQLMQNADGTFSHALIGFNYNPSEYTLVTKDGIRYRYDQFAGLREIVDRNDNQLTFTEDGIFGSGGQTIPFIRDSLGRISEILDPAGNSLRYDYGARGNLVSTTDQENLVTTYSYLTTPAHFLETIVDPLGRITLRAEFDEAGRLTSTTDALGGTVRQVFDVESLSGTFTDANGNVTTLVHDERGNVLTETDPLGNVTTFLYDDNDNEIAVTDPRGFTTTRTYDALGNVTSITDPLGNTRTAAFDEFSNITSVTDELGRTTTATYDHNGNLIELTGAAGNVRTQTFDAMGRLETQADRNGNTTTLIYSGDLPLPSQLVFADGAAQAFEYNIYGQVTQLTDELGNAFVTEYDSLGRILAERRPDSQVTTFTYDGPLLTEQAVAISATESSTTTFEYDDANRIIRQTDANGGVISFTYDAVGNRTSLTDPVGNTTTFDYDAENRLIRETDPLSNFRIFDYDGNDNQAEVIDRNGRRRTFDYDPLNRMTTEHWWDGAAETRAMSFTYDAVGNLLTESDPDSAYTYTYDSLNRLTSVDNAGTPDIPNVVLTYDYDPEGNRISAGDNFGVDVNSIYDSRHRLTSRTWHGGGIDPARIDFAYNARGDRTETRRYADLAGTQLVSRSTFDYDDSGRTLDIRHLNALDEVLVDYDYTYDLADRLIAESHHGNSMTYGYDPTGQLLSADHTILPDEFYNYDLNGNRTSSYLQPGGTVIGPANQILSDDTFEYEYDAEGNLILKREIATGNTIEYEYDHRNRLTQVVEKSYGGIILEEVQFAYDTQDRRTAKIVNGAPIYSVYDGPHVWADYNAATDVVDRFLYGDRIDEILSRFRPTEGTAWHLSDRLGTVRDLNNSVGAIINHIDYASFGSVLNQSNELAGDRFLFTGREFDSELDLYNLRSRYYGSTMGRFASRDSIGFAGGDSNLYRYANNSVVNATDPMGTTAVLGYVSLLCDRVLPTVQFFEEYGKAVLSVYEGIGGILEEAPNGNLERAVDKLRKSTAELAVTILKLAIQQVRGVFEPPKSPHEKLAELRDSLGDLIRNESRGILDFVDIGCKVRDVFKV